MTGLKTIVATAVIVCVATAIAFGGVHLGSPSAGASTASAASPKATKATYTVRLTEGQLEHLATLLGGQKAKVRAQHDTEHKASHDARARTASYQASVVQSRATWAGSSTTHLSETPHSTCPTVAHDGSRDGDHSGSDHDGVCNDGGGCD
jgi:hypothetical protein